MSEREHMADGRAFDVGSATATAFDQGFGCGGERSNGSDSLIRIAPLAPPDTTDNEIGAVS